MEMFLKTHESKNKTYSELWQIYRKNAISPEFRGSMYSALALIILPSATNLYYTFKPNALFAKVMPIVMPVVCLAQYLAMVKYDLEGLCYKKGDDAETVRRKFRMINQLETYNY